MKVFVIQNSKGAVEKFAFERRSDAERYVKKRRVRLPFITEISLIPGEDMESWWDELSAEVDA